MYTSPADLSSKRSASWISFHLSIHVVCFPIISKHTLTSIGLHTNFDYSSSFYVTITYDKDFNTNDFNINIIHIYTYTCIYTSEKCFSPARAYFLLEFGGGGGGGGRGGGGA